MRGALRRYRGAHRTGAWTVAELVADVAARTKQARRDHLRSLRRPLPDPYTPVWIGTRYASMRFFAMVPPVDAAQMVATLTITPPDDAPTSVPAVLAADDVPTGPILIGEVEQC